MADPVGPGPGEQAAVAAVPGRRQRQRSRGWTLTLNNHTDQETTTLLDQCTVSGASFIIQEERGDNGTPHLQGFVHFRHQTAFSTLRQWNHRIHWERAVSITASVRYCSDPAKRAGRIWASGYTYQDRDLRLIEENDMHEWQSTLLADVRGVPDMRSILWYADLLGGGGKTAFCRWAVHHLPHTLFVSSGTAKDITYQVVKSTWDPKLVIFNLPRSSEGAMSYAAIESLKDGLLFSGKYEGGCKLFPPPHVVVFANFFPDESKLSADRWNIKEIIHNPIRVRDRQ